MSSKDSPLFLGIDVGTGSARAGIFTSTGKQLGSASHPIKMWKPAPDFVEQSSEDIWRACCQATKAAIKQAKIKAERIHGIGFDATCSLVVLDANDQPVTVSPSGNQQQNVIVWMDHRAVAQANLINQTKHPVLRYIGGVISPEMETPKLLWLKKKMPTSWKKAAKFLDLPDFLTYRATGADIRSLCSTVCKWTYLGQEGLDGKGWSSSYFKKIGLGDLASEKFKRIGTRVRPMGEPMGKGLSAKSAAELGLKPGTAVGVSIIDAHAGGLGMLGAKLSQDKNQDLSVAMNHRLALIGGTSSCHMAASIKPKFIHGIWGPYYSAMIPELWLTEGGQSATGALIDHVIYTHPVCASLQKEAKNQGKSIYELLNARLDVLAKQEAAKFPALLTKDLQVLPDFHGNRSPRANPSLKGGITGLTLSASVDDLARLYLATIQAVAYGTRHILEEMNKKGYAINTIFICGGGTKNPVFLREHADITGCRLILPKEPEAVLLGSAVLGAVASGHYPSVLAAMQHMNIPGKLIQPAGGAVAQYHAKKYQVFHRMHRDFMDYRKLMQ